MSDDDPTTRIDAAVAVAFAALGGAAIWAATRHGVSLSPDSAAYLSMARRIEAHKFAALHHWSDPVAGSLDHWQPLIGVLVAAARWTGADALERTRWITVVVGASSTAMMFALVRRHAGRLAASATALALVASVGYTHIVGALSSEGIYLMLLLAAWLLLDLARSSERASTPLLVGASLAAFLSFTARHVGIATVAALLVTVVWLSPRKARARAVCLVVVVGVIPSVAWSVVYGSDRVFGVHPPTHRVSQALRTVAEWVVPSRWLDHGAGRAIGALVAVLTLLLTAWWLVGWARVAWRSRPTGDHATVAAMVVFATLYLVAVLASETFFDAGIPLNQRIMLPAVASGLVILGIRIGPFLDGALVQRRPILGQLVVAFGAVVIVGLAVQAAADIDVYPPDDFSQPPYAGSPTMAYVDHLPLDALVYSNGRAAFSLYQDRVTRRFVTAAPGSPTRAELGQLASELRRQHGVIAYLDIEKARADLPAPKLLEQSSQFRVVRRYRDGVILGPR
jgi:hypothetical protein